MKKECHTTGSEQSKREGGKERCRKGSGKVGGFGWSGFLGGLALGAVAGGILVFFVFDKSMKVVVEIESNSSQSLTESSNVPSDSGAAETKEVASEKDEKLPRYRSVCLLEVRPRIQDVTSQMEAGVVRIPRGFINTQREIILAPSTLVSAMEKIQLEERWGKDRASTMKLLREIVTVEPKRGTDLIEISVVYQDKAESRMICEAIYEAYAQKRKDLEMGIRKAQLQAIKSELQNKSDRVAELRKRMKDIAEKWGLVYVEAKVGGRHQLANEGLVDIAEKNIYRVEREKELLQLQVAKLEFLDLEGKQSTLTYLPDVRLTKEYGKCVEARRDLKVLESRGLGDKHPDVRKKRAEVASLEQDLKKKADEAFASLKHKVLLLEQQIQKNREFLDSKKSEGTEIARNIQEFNIARKEYQTASAIKQAMEEKYNLEKAKMIVPMTNVILHWVTTTRE